MNNEAKKAASGWDRVENGQAQPEHLELWDAINEVVAASGGSTSCTNVARQKAVVRVHQAVTAIVAASLARATAPHRGDICMVRVPEPEGGMEECSQTLPCPRHGPAPIEPVTDQEIEQAIVAASDANFAVGEWDGDTADEPFDAVTQVADAANQELRKLFQRARAEPRASSALVEAARITVFEGLRNGEGDFLIPSEKLREALVALRTALAADRARTPVMHDEAFAMTPEQWGEVKQVLKRPESPIMALECVDCGLVSFAKHPGSNLYHVKDNDRPMFVLADSWGEAVAAYEAMVRRENDLAPDEEVEILGVDFVANRRDILVAPIDVEAKR